MKFLFLIIKRSNLFHADLKVRLKWSEMLCRASKLLNQNQNLIPEEKFWLNTKMVWLRIYKTNVWGLTQFWWKIVLMLQVNQQGSFISKNFKQIFSDIWLNFLKKQSLGHILIKMESKQKWQTLQKLLQENTTLKQLNYWKCWMTTG